MKNGKLRTVFLLAGIVALAVFALVVVQNRRPDVVRSSVSYTENVTGSEEELIPDAPVPLAAPEAVEPVLESIPLTSTLEAVNAGRTAQAVPVAAAPQTPAEEGQTPSGGTENGGEEGEGETPPEESETPAKAVKPDDITDVDAMSKYLFDAATEFWATEKEFCGTSTRPVSTRVASSIGAGTAVDCPGGDTTRTDKNGVEHDSYAIADHFREYVEMPDLQNFKIYLSDKDYTVNPYGAREDVTGAYYQYGGDRATYTPPAEKTADGAAPSDPPADAAGDSGSPAEG